MFFTDRRGALWGRVPFCGANIVIFLETNTIIGLKNAIFLSYSCENVAISRFWARFPGSAADYFSFSVLSAAMASA